MVDGKGNIQQTKQIQSVKKWSRELQVMIVLSRTVQLPELGSSTN